MMRRKQVAVWGVFAVVVGGVLAFQFWRPLATVDANARVNGTKLRESEVATSPVKKGAFETGVVESGGKAQVSNASPFALDIPEAVVFDPGCPATLTNLNDLANPRQSIVDSGLDPSVLMPPGGGLTSWTRYFTDADGAELQVAVRRVASDRFVVRARKTKPDGSLERITLPGHKEEPTDEARAREQALQVHNAVAALRAGVTPRTRTMVLQRMGKDGLPSFFEFDGGRLVRASLSDAASCSPESENLRCNCDGVVEDGH